MFPFSFGAKKSEERDFRFWPHEKWNESHFSPFFARSLTLVPRSLLLNRTEMRAMQAMKLYALASGLAWENRQHFTSTYNWFPWEIMSEVWLMTCHNPDLGSASDWLKQISLVAWPLTIRSTTQIWVVKHHRDGMSARVCTVLKSPWILREIWM